MPPPRGIVQQFDQYLHGSRLLRPGQRLLVACSGGADSVALLRLMHSVNQSKYWRWKLVVGHVDHGLRGRQSLADQRFVQRTAKQLGLRCVSKTVRLKKRAGDHVSEATARQARYDALAQLARRQRCAAIVLAHHADDQAETVLMRILRGCSIAGLGAMRPRRKMGAIRLVRPLLGFERSALQGYLREIGQVWREDHTNALPHYLRNRIRMELMPQLQAYQPAIRQLLVRLAAQARESERAHRHAVAVLMPRAVTIRRKTATLSRDVLKKQPPMIVGMVLRRAIVELGGSLGRLTAETIHRAVTAVQCGTTGQQIQLGAFTLHVQREDVILRPSGGKQGRSRAKNR